MKKYLLLLLLLLIPINIYAANDTGGIMITGINEGDSFAAYRIAREEVNSTTNTLYYTFTEDFNDYLNNSTSYGVPDYSGLTVDEFINLLNGDINNGITNPDSELQSILSGFSAYCKDHTNLSIPFVNNGQISLYENADAGVYLVKATESTKIYSMMVGTVNLVANGTIYVRSRATISAKYTDPVINSTITDSGSTESSSLTEASYSFGDSFTNKVEIPLPSYPVNATNDTFELDLFEISYVEEIFNIDIEDSLRITDGISTIKVDDNNKTALVDNNNAPAGSITKNKETDENNVTTVSYTVRLDLSKLKGDTVEVQYDTVLKDQAKIGSSGNLITNTLRYSTDPYGDSVNTINVTNKIYTYALELKNTNYYNNNVPVNSAKYELYKDEALKEKVCDLETDSNGYALHLGLEEGTYYLKQVDPGYNDSNKKEQYRLNKDNVVAKIKIDGSTAGSQDGYYIVNIRSKIEGNLPFTGSTGVYFFTIIGLLVIIVGGVYYYKKQK